jgi:lipopolysaccharide export system protein LptA
MRTLVLIAGVLLAASLGAFLVIGKWKHRINLKDLPQQLGVNIVEEANGVTYTHSFGAHAQFKIHASKVVQLKNDHATLHDVKIELYGDDGARVDRIEGAEFDYDQKTGKAQATGPVEITLMRPGVAPAIAPKAAVAGNSKPNALSSAAATAASGEIHVKTSGLSFDQKSGIATTDQHVEFSVTQGMGSSEGASYDSQQGHLVLDRAVVLDLRREGESIAVNAQHAEMDREALDCDLRGATAHYRGGQATAGVAKILFREDGSAVRLDASQGFTLTSATGGHLAAPQGNLVFDGANHPRHGHLEGGVTMDSASSTPAGSRQMQGSAPAAELEFTNEGELKHAHLERGVELVSHEQSPTPEGLLRLNRTWRSPVADVEFREAAKAGSVKQGQMELASMHGTGGVVISSESQRGKAAAVPSKLEADEVTGEFGPASELRLMTGTGHASLDETTATGTRQTATGDRMEAHFSSAPGASRASGTGGAKTAGSAMGAGGASQIQAATLEGNVVLVQIPVTKLGTAAQPLRATAGRAEYEGAGEWLHLTRSPRVDNGGLQISADKLDVSRASGDAFAHGNVKATWFDAGKDAGGKTGGNAGLGGQGVSHVIAAEAEMQQATGVATFKGQARLWQQGNSITAPVIVLNRQKQTLFAQGLPAKGGAAVDPVRAVLVSAGGPGAEPKSEKGAGAPSVIRVSGGEFNYSDVERRALMHGAGAGSVVAETATATSVSDEMELFLRPAANPAGKDAGGVRNAFEESGSGQVDRMIARGHVVLTSQNRRGTGEQMVYSGQSGEYVLTGTASTPPRMTDPERGTVTGEALIFHSRDDSVSIEGGGRKTSTETRTPK